MTPETLLARLERLPADAPLVFETDDGPALGGYHVTELKHARISSIDCGARQAQWDEAVLQLLDGGGGEHMMVGKFTAILAQSIRHVPGLGPAAMSVEFAHANRGLRVFRPDAPQLEDQAVVVRLAEARPVCKPARDATLAVPAPASAGKPCRGTAASACCG